MLHKKNLSDKPGVEKSKTDELSDGSGVGTEAVTQFEAVDTTLGFGMVLMGFNQLIENNS